MKVTHKNNWIQESLDRIGVPKKKKMRKQLEEFIQWSYDNGYDDACVGAIKHLKELPPLDNNSRR